MNMEDWTEFSEWLKNELEAQGLSSRKLEKLKGISHCTTQEYTRRKRCPSLDMFLRVLDALGKKVMIVDK